MEYHRDDRYLSEIEVLLVLDKGPADAQFHEGHIQGPYPTASPTKHLQLSRPFPHASAIIQMTFVPIRERVRNT